MYLSSFNQFFILVNKTFYPNEVSHKKCSGCDTGDWGIETNTAMAQLANQNLTKGMQINKYTIERNCIPSIQAKGTRLSFSKNYEPSQMKSPLELIHKQCLWLRILIDEEESRGKLWKSHGTKKVQQMAWDKVDHIEML